MYTDTTRPNHLGQEVIDNSVDEALAGHAQNISVILEKDQSLEIIDDGRGMPTDIHPEEGVSGVELIFCKFMPVVNSQIKAISSQAVCMVLVFRWLMPYLPVLMSVLDETVKSLKWHLKMVIKLKSYEKQVR